MINCLLGQGCPLNHTKLVVICVIVLTSYSNDLLFYRSSCWRLLLGTLSPAAEQSWRDQSNPGAVALQPEVAGLPGPDLRCPLVAPQCVRLPGRSGGASTSGISSLSTGKQEQASLTSYLLFATCLPRLPQLVRYT